MKDYLHDIGLSEREASGIARVLRLCDVFICEKEFTDKRPVDYDPVDILALLDEMNDYRELLCTKLEDRGAAPPV
jgi:hypothetical protein